MLIRYFAEMSSSPTGLTALAYVPRLLALGKPVRLISAVGMADLSGPWGAHAKLLNTGATFAPPAVPGGRPTMTLLDDDGVKVVCCSPERWAWQAKVGPKPTDVETCELYTRGVRNVMLVPKGAHAQGKGWAGLRSVLKYQALVVDEADAAWWMGLTPECVVVSQNPQALEIALALE